MARKDKLGKRREIDESTEALKFAGVDADYLKIIDKSHDLFGSILIELKVNNLYLSKIIGEELSEEDIE